jgi:hypothetical protein
MTADIAPTISLNGSDPQRLREEARAMRQAIRNLPDHDLNARDWQLAPERFREVQKICEEFGRAAQRYDELCYAIEVAAADYQNARKR